MFSLWGEHWQQFDGVLWLLFNMEEWNPTSQTSRWWTYDLTFQPIWQHPSHINSQLRIVNLRTCMRESKLQFSYSTMWRWSKSHLFHKCSWFQQYIYHNGIWGLHQKRRKWLDRSMFKIKKWIYVPNVRSKQLSATNSAKYTLPPIILISVKV